MSNDLDWSQIERQDLPQTNNTASQTAGDTTHTSPHQNTPPESCTSPVTQDGSTGALLYPSYSRQRENHHTDTTGTIFNPPGYSGSGQRHALSYSHEHNVPYTMHQSYPPAYSPPQGVHNGHFNGGPSTRGDRVLPSEEPPSYNEVMEQHNRYNTCS